MSAFHALLLRLAAAQVPESIVQALALSKLTPLKKGREGVRPIAAPSLLRRLAGKLLVRGCKLTAAQALGKKQFAIGTAAGTELLAHTVRALTEAHPDLVVTALDASNAFCTAGRQQCLEQLRVVAPNTSYFADCFLKRESRYLFWDCNGKCHQLKATDGVDQGDPLSPLLFASGLAPSLEELEAELRAAAAAKGLDPEMVFVFAFLDDVIVLTPPLLASQVQTSSGTALGRLGLQLAPLKTQVWSKTGPKPVGVNESTWKPEGLTLVGVPLGESPPDGTAAGEPDDSQRVTLGEADFAKETCAQTVSRAKTFLEKLGQLPANASPHLPAVQVAALLLRWCGCTKVTHLLRANPPSQTAEAAGAFDEAALACYETLAALDPLSEVQSLQCQLPLSLGGRGLTS